jgi:hypothetical protein
MSSRPRKTTTTRTASKKRVTASRKKGATASKKLTTTSRKRATTATRAGQASLTCPECGRSFTRPAALGAHRRSHGVTGTSANATRTRTTRNTRTRGTAQSTSRRSTANPGTGINRDALLQALFPAGIPAREDTIRELNAWLDQAEQIARAR